jgi:hypothetical protein
MLYYFNISTLKFNAEVGGEGILLFSKSVSLRTLADFFEVAISP